LKKLGDLIKEHWKWILSLFVIITLMTAILTAVTVYVYAKFPDEIFTVVVIQSVFSSVGILLLFCLFWSLVISPVKEKVMQKISRRRL